MTREYIVGACVWIAIASAAASAQQPGGSTGQVPQAPATATVERAYPAGDVTPSRTVQTRSASDGREVVTEIVEMPGLDGTLQPVQERTTETTRTGPGSARIRHDIVAVGAQRQRTLLEKTESEQEALADGGTSTVRNTWTADVNGRLGLAYRQIEETRSIAPNISRTDTTVLVPGINEPVRESERRESVEHQVNPAVVRHEGTQLVRDLNGRWQAVESRSLEVRNIGPSERVEEETIQRLDTSGKLAVSERSITRHSQANGRDDVVVETYGHNAEGYVPTDTRMELSRRVRTSTTGAADGSRNTVEEVEARNPVAPGDPMRVIRQIVTSVRQIGPNRWATERRVFELDANGRLQPVLTEATIEK